MREMREIPRIVARSKRAKGAGRSRALGGARASDAEGAERASASRERAIDDELRARDAAARTRVENEIYCVSRPFQEWGRRGVFAKLPSAAREALQTAGVAHFMLVYRDTTSGELRQFDFGPLGKDMHNGRWLELAGGKTSRGRTSEEGARDTVYCMMKRRQQKHRSRRKGAVVRGEIREESLEELPPKSYFVGTTHLSLDDVRGFNGARDLMYELHANDCRHYLNDLSFFLCKESAVSSRYVKSLVLNRIRKHKNIWAHHLWLTHAISDVENVERWSQAGRAAGATLMFGLGVRLFPFATPARHIVTWGSGALASTSEDVPIVREVLGFGSFLLDSSRSALGLLISAHGAVAQATAQARKGIDARLRLAEKPQDASSSKPFTAPSQSRNRKPASFAKFAHGHKRPWFAPAVGVRVSPVLSLSLPSVAVGAANLTQGFLRSRAQAINGLGRNLRDSIIRRFIPRASLAQTAL